MHEKPVLWFNINQQYIYVWMHIKRVSNFYGIAHHQALVGYAYKIQSSGVQPYNNMSCHILAIENVVLSQLRLI